MAFVRNPLQVLVDTSSSLRPCNFSTRDAADHAAELTAEFPPVGPQQVADLHFFPIRRRSKSVQAAGGSKDGTSQTTFNYPRHATSQYEARQFSQNEIEQHISSKGFQTFLSKASLRVERILVQNDLFNPFNDHISQLKRTDRPTTKLPSEALTDDEKQEKISGDRAPRRLLHQAEICEGNFVSAIHIHPSFPGVLAAGYAAKVQLEDRQAHRDTARQNRHFVLIWKTSKLMEPTLILEAAEDIVTVRFNSQHPYIIAAACLSGMIVLWDLSPHAGLLKGVKSKWSTRASAGTPVIVPVAATLENYPALTRRIEWTPSSVEFTAKGPFAVSNNKTLYQLYSGYDGFMTVWDARLPEENFARTSIPVPRMPTRIRPVFKMLPMVKDKRRDVSVTCFAMIDHTEKRIQSRMSDVAVYPPICIAGTEEGEIFIMDWRTYSETERGAACTASLCVAFHDAPVVDILPSPHIANTVLSIGGRIWALWKSVDLEGPVLELPPRPAAIQSAAWSPWQSSVVAVGLANGLVEVWDIIESTSRPQNQIRISRSAITALGFGKDESGTYIAIADSDGAGKITLLPFFTQSLSPDLKELKKVESFMEAEVRHRMAMAVFLETGEDNLVTTTAPPPEPVMPFTDEEEYFQAYHNVEEKILHEVETMQ